jgi:hypothetical protein
MTVEEMHIAVNLGVQKIASFQADALLPEEIDYELNTAVRRFISQRYNTQGNKYQRGFEQSQKRLDDLRHLVEDYTTTNNSYMGIGYSSQTSGNINIYRYKFPTDYMFLVNVLSEIVHNCTKEKLDYRQVTLVKEFLKIPLTTPIEGYRIQSILLANTEGLPEVVISAPSGLTYDQLIGPFYQRGIRPSLSNNDSYTDRYFDTVSADSPPADGNELYLELQYKQGENRGFNPISASAISNNGNALEGIGDIEDASEYNGAYAIIVWVNPATGETEEVKSMIVPTESFIIQRVPKIPTDGTQADYRLYRTNCKFSQQDDIYALLDDPFNSTKETALLYTIQETFIDLYTKEYFAPRTIQIKYIRKPASISKRDGIGCELPEHTHHEIVEMAVKSILEGFESPRYQTQSSEVLDSE